MNCPACNEKSHEPLTPWCAKHAPSWRTSPPPPKMPKFNHVVKAKLVVGTYRRWYVAGEVVRMPVHECTFTQAALKSEARRHAK